MQFCSLYDNSLFHRWIASWFGFFSHIALETSIFSLFPVLPVLQALAAAVKGVGSGLHSRAGDVWALLLRPDLLRLSDFKMVTVRSFGATCMT